MDEKEYIDLCSDDDDIEEEKKDITMNNSQRNNIQAVEHMVVAKTERIDISGYVIHSVHSYMIYYLYSMI